jgi:hypothetical protein
MVDMDGLSSIDNVVPRAETRDDFAGSHCVGNAPSAPTDRRQALT